MNVLVQDTSLTAIADAIRTKAGTEDTYKPAEMAPAILALADKLNFNVQIITRTASTQSLSIGDYVDSPDDILFMVWTCGSVLNGATGYNTAFYVKADPVENEEFPGRRPMYAANISVTSNKATIVAIDSTINYGLGYWSTTDTLTLTVKALTSNTILSEGFKNGTIFLVSKG